MYSRFIVIVVCMFPSLAFAQYEATYCDSVYNEWNTPDSLIIDYHDIPEIVGGLQALMNDLVYPDSAIKIGLEERALVRLLVTEIGEPKCIRFLKLTHSIFKPTILTAIHKQRFEPAEIDGQPYEMPLQFPVVFKLD